MGVPKLCACGHPRKVQGEDGHGGRKEAGCKGCKRYRSAKGWKLVEPTTARARRVVVLPEVATALLLYDLRHTCATLLLLLAGEHAKGVSERLGHASVTLTLNTYSHVPRPSCHTGSTRPK